MNPKTDQQPESGLGQGGKYQGQHEMKGLDTGPSPSFAQGHSATNWHSFHS